MLTSMPSLTPGIVEPPLVWRYFWARQAVELGAGELLLTSMDADGHRAGYDIELNRAISEAVTVPVIASGGAGTLEDLLTGGIVIGGGSNWGKSSLHGRVWVA